MLIAALQDVAHHKRTPPKRTRSPTKRLLPPGILTAAWQQARNGDPRLPGMATRAFITDMMERGEGWLLKKCRTRRSSMRHEGVAQSVPV
jgi:hypothetical protein